MYPGHNFKADVTITDATGEIALKQLDDFHNTSWNTVGLQVPLEAIPVYAIKSFAKVNEVDVETMLPF